MAEPTIVERLRRCFTDTPAYSLRMEAANEIERLTEALQVAKVGFEQIKAAPTITDAEIKRVALAKIEWALNIQGNQTEPSHCPSNEREGGAVSIRICLECGGEGRHEVSHPQWDDPYYAVAEQCRPCGGVGYVEEDPPAALTSKNRGTKS